MSPLHRRATLTLKFILPAALTVALVMTAGTLLLAARQARDATDHTRDMARMVEAQFRVLRTYFAMNFPPGQAHAPAGAQAGMPPLPATATLQIAAEMSRQGWFSVRLVGLRPLNPDNGPRDGFERRGLRALAAGQPVYESVEEVGGRLYLRRMTPDVATVGSCTGCHTGFRVGDTVGGLVVDFPLDENKTHVLEHVRGLRNLAIALVVAIVGLLWLVIRSVVTRPLNELLAGAEEVAAGRLDHQVAEVSGDEIGRLARAFNAMTRSLRQRFRDMEGLIEVGRAVSSAQDLDALLRLIAERGRALLGAEQAGICLGGGREREGEADLRVSTFAADDPRREAVERESEPHLREVCAGRAARLAHDVAGFGAVLYVPMVVADQVVGALVFFGQAGRAVDGWRLEVADMLAQQAAAAIEKARLQGDLVDSYLSTIAALAAAVEAKDAYTGDHSQRLAGYGMAVARRLGMSPGEVEVVRQGCLLHDIGKIGIPDAILLKPGRLSAEEFAAMKTHSERGAAIVSLVPSLREVAAVIRHHHERWDGRGYPDGLAAEDIPLAARIVAVVDAYEAMTSDRPYRRALPVEAAVEELRRCAGTQFDPDVVRVFFIEVLDQEMAVTAG